LKQEEIKKIQKDEPLLYQQFAGDINKLDSTFHTLKKQLPENPNREQLLEAMIQNLQLQEALLNRQLNIIKQINNAKKTEYEKAIKSA
ncbi:MAG TPA: anti-sigma factor, partial [Chitinophagaceae bacterium]